MARTKSINSTYVSGSVGNTTYRKVGNEIIASQKRGSSEASIKASKGENGEGLNPRCALFKLMSIYYNAHRTAINAAFTASPRVSAFNTFMKVNYSGLEKAWQPSIRAIYLGGVEDISVNTLEIQLQAYVTGSNYPKNIFRAYRAGFAPVILSSAWVDDITLQPYDELQEVVAVSSNMGDYFYISKSTPAILSGTNINDIKLTGKVYPVGEDEEPREVSFVIKVQPTKQLTVDWRVLLATAQVEDFTEFTDDMEVRFTDVYDQFGNSIFAPRGAQ